MATLTIRNVPDEVRDALRVRAAKNGRSMEAELQAMLKASLEATPVSRPELKQKTPDAAQLAHLAEATRRLRDKLRANWADHFDPLQELLDQRRTEAKREFDGC